MKHQVLKDFSTIQKVSDNLISKYNGKVPNEILDLWKEFGFGTFMDDYIKVVNPDDFEEILQETSKRYKDAIVLFSTSLGDLIVWSDNYVRLVSYRYGTVKTILFSFDFFFNNIRDEDFRNEDLEWQPYQKAIEKYGKPAYNECFGYVPLLGIGGEEKVENLDKVKLVEHIYLITEFMGPIE